MTPRNAKCPGTPRRPPSSGAPIAHPGSVRPEQAALSRARLPVPVAAPFSLRLARADDIPELEALIPLSVRRLQAGSYSALQMEAALGPVFGVDRQLIAD